MFRKPLQKAGEQDAAQEAAAGTNTRHRNAPAPLLIQRFLRSWFIFFVVCSISPPVALAATPTSVKATFEMYQNNILFATVDEIFTAANGKYNVDSNANPAGILTLV